MRTVAIAAVILMLAAPAYADQRDEDIHQMEVLGKARKIAQRGHAANERVIVNGRLNDKELGAAGANIDGIDANLEVLEKKADWTAPILAVGASLLGLTGIGIFAKSRINKAREAAQNTLATALQGVAGIVQPGVEAGREPFLATAPAGATGGQGSEPVHDAYSGGRSGGDAAGQPSVIDAVLAPTASGTFEIPAGVRVRMGNGNGSS